jgi:hypothetical protein
MKKTEGRKSRDTVPLTSKNSGWKESDKIVFSRFCKIKQPELFWTFFMCILVDLLWYVPSLGPYTVNPLMNKWQLLCSTCSTPAPVLSTEMHLEYATVKYVPQSDILEAQEHQNIVSNWTHRVYSVSPPPGQDCKAEPDTLSAPQSWIRPKMCLSTTRDWAHFSNYCPRHVFRQLGL